MIEPLLARKDIGDLLQDEEFLILVGILMATLLIGALILSYVERWRKRQMSDEDMDVNQLGSFRAMFERGEINREEYERIRARVASRLKEKIAPTASPVKPAEPTIQEPDSTPPPT